MNYTIKVADGNGDFIGEFDRFRNLKFGKKLNNYGVLSVDIPLSDDKAESLVALRIYSIWVYRDDELVWAGEQAIRQGKLDDKGGNWATIYAFTWFEQLSGRYTDEERIFSGVDKSDIAWTLIDETQDISTFGFTEGDLELVDYLDVTYENKNIAEAIIGLGIDFEINDSKAFSAKPFIGIDRTELILEYGHNIKSIEINEDFTHPVNRAVMIGSSGVTTDPLRVERNDSASQTQYKLREAISNEMSTADITNLEAKGDALLLKYGMPLFKISMNLIRSSFPTIVDFSIGDIITLKIKNSIYDIEESYRVYEWTVDYDENDTEKLDLVLGNFNIPELS